MDKPKTKKELDRLIESHFERGEMNLNDIDTSLITDMSWLFYSSANSLDFDVSEWNVKKVKNMEGMFYLCKNFNCDISGWDVRNVRETDQMFLGCTSFNQDLGNWKLEKTRCIIGMFCNCQSFNQDLSRWNFRKLVANSMYNRDRSMFHNCIKMKEENLPKYYQLYNRKEEDSLLY